MDPATTARSTDCGWIPRTRGDGPSTRVVTRAKMVDSPHPRGWTLFHSVDLFRLLGFPAPAGMDLIPSSCRRDSARIPRTRGDGPAGNDVACHLLADSPHPRGWTAFAPSCNASVTGFPAPAGMDPTRARCWCCRSRIPRTRGDGPEPTTPPDGLVQDSPHPRGWTPERCGSRSDRTGFPAPAGMDLAQEKLTLALRRIPRTRGDGPLSFGR